MISLQSIADNAAESYGVPLDLFRSLIASESSWNPSSTRSDEKGRWYRGLAQFSDSTAKEYGVMDSYDPSQALYGAAHYLSDLYHQTGDWGKAVALYKGFGEGGLNASEVDRAWGLLQNGGQTKTPQEYNSQTPLGLQDIANITKGIFSKQPKWGLPIDDNDKSAPLSGGKTDSVSWWTKIKETPTILLVFLVGLLLIIFGLIQLSRSKEIRDYVAA